MVQRGGGGAEHVYLGMTISPFSRVFFIQYSLHVAYGMVELPPRFGSGRVETVRVRSRRVGLRQDSSGQVASGRVASRQFGSGRVASARLISIGSTRQIGWNRAKRKNERYLNML